MADTRHTRRNTRRPAVKGRNPIAAARNKGQRAVQRGDEMGTARLLRGVDPARLNANGRALLAQAIRQNRPVAAMAVPKLTDAVKALGQAISPTTRTSAMAVTAKTLGDNAMHQVGLLNRAKHQAVQAGNVAVAQSRFKHGDAATRQAVARRHGSAPSPSHKPPVTAAAPRRSGASSPTSRGPQPNPIARKRANSNARFNRAI